MVPETKARVQYDHVVEADNDLVRARKGEFWGFIDKKGNLIIPIIYQMVWDFKAGLAPVKKNGFWGFINTEGQVVIDFQYDFVYPSGQESFYAQKGEEEKVIQVRGLVNSEVFSFS